MTQVKKLANKVVDFFLSNIMVLVCIFFIIVGAILSDRFLSIKNITSIFRQMAIIGVLACGESVAIIAGGIDASVGGLLSASVIMYALVEHLPFPVACILVIIFGGLLGCISGLIITGFNTNPFIITMAMGVVGEGLALLLSGGRPFFLEEHLDVLQWIGVDYTGFMPNMVIIFFLVAIIGQIILSKTSLGLQWKSLGGNTEAAHWCGISTKKIKISAHTYSGMMCGIAGILCAARTSAADPIAGEALQMEAMSAAVLGGTLMGGGGIGSVIGAIMGSFILGMIKNLFNILNLSTYWQDIAKGLIIIFALIIGSRSLARKPRRTKE